MSKKFLLVLTAIAMTGITYGCSNKVNNINFAPDYTQLNSSTEKQGPITIQVKLDVPPFISTQSELSGIALMDDGKIIKYHTLKTGNSYTATTIVYESKWVKLESHPTTGSEAQTILKLASQGSYAKEYKTLKDRYSEIGLIDLK